MVSFYHIPDDFAMQSSDDVLLWKKKGGAPLEIITRTILPQEDGTLRLQRFCIRKDCRGQGAGRQTLAAVENRFRAEGLSAVVLDAKCSARGFYEACGYEAVSGEFLEAGVPHVAMRRAL